MASESATGRSSTELPTTKSRSPSPVHSVSSSSSPPNNDISPAPDDVNEQMLLEPSPSDRDENASQMDEIEYSIATAQPAVITDPDFPPSWLAQFSDVYISPILSLGLSEKEKNASIIGEKLLLKEEQGKAPLSPHEDEAMKKISKYFQALDLSLVSLKTTRTVLRSVLRRHLHVKRLSISTWDDSLLKTLPSHLRLLVFSRNPPSDAAVGLVTKYCTKLESIRIHNGANLTDKSLDSLAKVSHLKQVFIKSDYKFSLDKLSSMPSLQFEFLLSKKFVDDITSTVDILAPDLIKNIRNHMNGIHNAAEISEATFASFKTSVDSHLARCIACIPKVALNYETATKAANEQFYSQLADRLDIVTFFVLRNIGVFDKNDEKHLDEWLTVKASWGAQCEICYSKPDDVSPHVWVISQYVSGMFRTMISDGGGIRVNSVFLEWVSPLVKALDLSKLPITDTDIHLIVSSCPELQILLLAEAPNITSNAITDLFTLKHLQYLRLSGALHVSPALIVKLQQHGVTVDYDPLTQQLYNQLCNTATSMGLQLSKEVTSTLVHSKLKDCNPANFKGVFSEVIEPFVAKVLQFFRSLKMDEELAPASRKLFLTKCACSMNTQALVALHECDKADKRGLFSLLDVSHERIWLGHIASLLLDAQRKKEDEEKVKAQQQQQHVLSAISTILKPLLPNAQQGHSAATLDTLQNQLENSLFASPGVPSPQYYAMCKFFHRGFSGIFMGSKVKDLSGSNRTEINADEFVKCWGIFGKDTFDHVLASFKSGLLSLVSTFDPNPIWEAKDKEFLEEAKQILQITNSNGEKLKLDDILNVFQKTYVAPTLRVNISISDVISLCRKLREACVSLSEFFSEHPTDAETKKRQENVSDDMICGMWMMFCILEILEVFGQYFTKADRNPFLLRELVICSLFGADMIPVLQMEKMGLSTFLGPVGYSLIWGSLCNSLTPQYHIYVQESTLTISEHWRSYNYVLIKKEKPKGMAHRRYVFECIFSEIFRRPGAKHALENLTHWENRVWNDGYNLLESIDLSDFPEESLKQIAQVLKLLTAEKCPLKSVNIQNTKVTWNELRFLPSTVKFLNLDDSFIGDEELAVVCSHCAEVKVLRLRNCGRITDKGVDLILQQLRVIKLIDISGNLNVTEDKLKQLGKQAEVRAVVFTAAVNKKFWNKSCKIADKFEAKLKEKLKGDPISLLAPGALAEALSSETLQLIPDSVHVALHKLEVPEYLTPRIFKRTLKAVLYQLHPLSALIVEQWNWFGVPLSDDEIEEVWMKVFHNLKEKTPKPPKKDTITAKQHCIEYYLNSRVFNRVHVDSFTQMSPRKALAWYLGRYYISKLDFTGAIHAGIVNETLEQIRKLGLVINEMHVSSEVVIRVSNFPPTISKLVVHGAVLPDDLSEYLHNRLATSDTAFELTDLEKDGALDSAAFKAAANFSDAVQIVLSSPPPHVHDSLLKAVYNWKREVEGYFKVECGMDASTHMEEFNQFLFRFLAALAPLQMILVAYAGMTLFLAQNQRDYLWKSVARRENISLEHMPADINPKEFVLGEYISNQILDVGLDDITNLLLTYCEKLYHLSVVSITTQFRIPAVLLSFTVPDGCITCKMAISAIGHKDELLSFRLQQCEDLQDNDTKDVCTNFKHLKVLELTGSRHLTVKSLEYIKESLPELGHLSIEMEPPAGVKTVEDLYKINKIARRMFRRLKEDLRIVLNDWTKQTPSVPVPSTSKVLII